MVVAGGFADRSAGANEGFSMASSRRKKISTLGTLAILLGGTAWAASRTTAIPVGPVLIGTGGLALALLAMLGAVLIGNTGKIVPFLGLLICSSAIAYGSVHNSTGVGVLDQFKAVIARFRPAPVAPQHAPAPAQVSPLPAADDPVGKGTIFDMSQGDRNSSRGAATSTPANVPPPLAQKPSPAPLLPAAPSLNATQRYTAAMNAVTRAHAQVDAAISGLLPELSQTRAYQAAKSELDDANTALKAARANNNEPGNAELVAAEQRYLNAKSAVQKLINAAADTDPASVAAKYVLTSAVEDLKAAKEDLAAAGGAGRQK
jgi:hypothetical protein